MMMMLTMIMKMMMVMMMSMMMVMVVVMTQRLPRWTRPFERIGTKQSAEEHMEEHARKAHRQLCWLQRSSKLLQMHAGEIIVIWPKVRRMAMDKI